MNKIIVNEVGPRDGLQNQTVLVGVDEKYQLIQQLMAAGINHIEVGSFVSPKAVPQMATTKDLVAQIGQPLPVGMSALIPNVKGLELAIESGVQEVAVVLSATETMNQKNINMSLQKTIDVCSEIVTTAKKSNLRAKAYIGVAFVCPFEGDVPLPWLLDLTKMMQQSGADEIVIADTIGAASPSLVKTTMDLLVAHLGSEILSGHFHDTRGMAIANCYASIEAGIRKFDSSIGGMGGCPFTPNASGNLATEDLVLLAQQCGYETNIDLSKLITAIEYASKITNKSLGGRSYPWLQRNYGAQGKVGSC
ncbi:hydroxymethylglutaryl-CoA lyase [Polynucleobacter sp. 30F-ANTBAC]|jgi:hydroxymethylglutaryl-CoA lyase|uniref:hydroxymethylglutaryl-CoA lyase n=1 Tax=Polynucleobacter sp. 30F-ANTBAC TaxID=2689095 RepID=UPI001C0AD940|nr:hydroxymethylglutaryl-CoA lyase [Polynucleobacter sp. 30F-ANTBAC]